MGQGEVYIPFSGTYHTHSSLLGATLHIPPMAASQPPPQAFWKGRHQTNTWGLRFTRALVGGVCLGKDADNILSPLQVVAAS